jgi:hypothetical protein
MNTPKTLFCQAPGRIGLLVTIRDGRQRKRTMRFKDAHAALTWCERKRVMMVYMPAVVMPDAHNNSL